MLKRILPAMFLVSVVLFFSVSASAEWDDSYRCTPALSFSGKAATCSAVVSANKSDAKITASMTLYRVNSNGTLSNCASWPSKTGTGYLSFSQKYSSVRSGNTYRLVITGTVKDSTGTHPIHAYRQAKCP